MAGAADDNEDNKPISLLDPIILKVRGLLELPEVAFESGCKVLITAFMMLGFNARGRFILWWKASSSGLLSVTVPSLGVARRRTELCIG